MFSSDVINSNKLNTTTDISCQNNDKTGGRVWSGFKFGGDNTGYKIEFAKCSNLKLEEDAYNMQKGSELGSACDCEMVNEQNGLVNCPNDKFLSTYFPLLKQGSCCMPCSADGKVKAGVDSGNCFPVTNSKDVTDVSCPDKTFIKNMQLIDGGSKLECCATKVSGAGVEKHNATNSNCASMKIPAELCSNEFSNTITAKCKEYGMANCDYESLREVESKCNTYGLRYLDTLTSKHQNTDSSVICHADNFDKLDSQCTKNGVSACSVYGLRDGQAGDVGSLKKDVVNIDKILGVMENSWVNKVFGNKTIAIVILSVFIVILLAVVFLVITHNSVTQK